MDIRDPNSRTRVTKLLCMSSSPEEKRKTIGDVFVKVSLSMCDSFQVGIRRTKHQAGSITVNYSLWTFQLLNRSRDFCMRNGQSGLRHQLITSHQQEE